MIASVEEATGYRVTIDVIDGTQLELKIRLS